MTTMNKLEWQIAAEREYARISRQGTRSIVPHLPWLRATVAHLQPTTILELGTGRSHSTLAMALGRDGSFIQSIDLINRRTGCRDILKDRVSFITGDIWDHYKDLISPDLLFIDDDHSAAQVLRELDEFSPRTSRCIIMHDTHLVRSDANVPKAIERWFANPDVKASWQLLWDCQHRPGITAFIRK